MIRNISIYGNLDKHLPSIFGEDIYCQAIVIFSVEKSYLFKANYIEDDDGSIDRIFSFFYVPCDLAESVLNQSDNIFNMKYENTTKFNFCDQKWWNDFEERTSSSDIFIDIDFSNKSLDQKFTIRSGDVHISINLLSNSTLHFFATLL